MDYCINNVEDLEILRQAIGELIVLRSRENHIANPEAVLQVTMKFLEQGYMPNCKAGVRFLVVMPDGSLVPCSLHRNKYSTQKEMMENFSRNNQCGGCYVAIRSYSELSILSQMKNVPKYSKRLFARNF